MSSYFAAVYTAEEGGFFAEFPDLPGCLTQAESLEELDAMLRDALFVFIDGLNELGEEPAAPRGHADVLKEVEAKGEADFQFLTLVAAPDKVKRIRVNISVVDTDLAIIDAAAAKRGLDRSGLLVQAAKRVAAGECEL